MARIEVNQAVIWAFEEIIKGTYTEEKFDLLTEEEQDAVRHMNILSRTGKKDIRKEFKSIMRGRK